MAAVAFEYRFLLLGIPLAIPLLWLIVVRPSAASETGRRMRYGMFVTRLLIIACLLGAAAGPYTTVTKQTPGEPEVRLLIDDSASMAVNPDVANELARTIERQGVPVSTATVAAGNRSAIGDGIIANLRPQGSLVVISDGQVTDGRGLGEAAELARSVNASISTIALEPDRRERYVRIDGPETTSVGIDNRFLVRVGGTQLTDRTTDVTVSVDGTTIGTYSIQGSGGIEFTHRFNRTGEHRIVARIGGGDVHGANDVFYRTVQAVSQPEILYVSRGAYPFREYLDQLYNVSTAQSVPSDLADYYAVVLQDVTADEIGNVEALQRFVIDGNGLVVVGGQRSYEYGGYTESTLGSMLPVRIGPGGVGQRARIVLAVDISGSTAGGMRVQKALALDVLDQLGDQHEVGIVAFNDRAYRIADLTPIARSRDDLADKIRRLQSGGNTEIAAGLQGSAELLGGSEGTVILISDGVDDEAPSISAARSLGQRNIRVISIGVGERIDSTLLREIGAVSGGNYLRADETSRLRLQFGDEERQFSASRLTVVDSDHFITAGVTLTTSLAQTNEVSVKEGADYLVAAGTGTPAVTAWRYGLGRVVSVTAYDQNGELDGLLAQPDSRLLSKASNWAIGDPQRKASGTVRIPDTRVGEATPVRYLGESPPEVDRPTFVRTSQGIYEANLVPQSTGVETLLSAEYAVNYPIEYAAYGTDPGLRQAVQTSGGQVFTADDAGAIARFARRQATQVREVREEWAWALLVAALVLYLLEVAARRLQAYRRNPFTN